MIRYYLQDGNRLEIIGDINTLKDDLELQNVIWIDMLTPTSEEIRAIETAFSLKFPTKQESEEIEISSRYWEEGKRIEINSYFLVNNYEDVPYNETVSFMMQDKLLISIRYKKLKSFDEFTNKLFSSRHELKDGFDIFTKIVDIRIDADADTIETLAREITKVRRQVFTDYVAEDEEMLEKISFFEDLNMKIRENVTDKQRILTSLLKSSKFPERLKKEVTIMLKDVRSLIEHTDFNFERLDYLQNIFLGTLSIEQNKVIKIFTIVNVIFLPPTLIASIYGMNFDLMPETHWEYGYLMAIGLMILSSVTPLWIFKKKGWM